MNLIINPNVYGEKQLYLYTYVVIVTQDVYYTQLKTEILTQCFYNCQFVNTGIMSTN